MRCVTNILICFVQHTALLLKSLQPRAENPGAGALHRACLKSLVNVDRQVCKYPRFLTGKLTTTVISKSYFL